VAGDQRINIGRLGEQIATEHLLQLGYEIVERNYRTRAGEIDLIAEYHSTLVFCEVKTLIARSQASGPSSPLECIRPGKRLQVRRMARAWLSDRPTGGRGYAEIRFDAIGITLTLARKTLRVEHLPNAF
jgi:putative endonuclease